MIDMIPVDSSLIAAIGYDEEGRKLHVRFHSGPTWIYEEVPQQKFELLRDAPSVGEYFLKHIKGVYPGTKQERT